MNREHVNPFGVVLSTPRRQYQVGRIINSSFPTPWRPFLENRDSPMKALMAWVYDTELKIFQRSAYLEDYSRMVGETMVGAIGVDQEIKSQRVGSFGMIHPSNPAFQLSQLLCTLIQFCRKTDHTELADCMLHATCGMMVLPPPYRSVHRIRDGYDITELRQSTVFRLLKYIFPEPFDDGKHYVTTELMKFGYMVERQVFLRAEVETDYQESIDHIVMQTKKLKEDENVYLDQIAPYPIDQELVDRMEAQAFAQLREMIRRQHEHHQQYMARIQAVALVDEEEEEEEEEEGDEEMEEEELEEGEVGPQYFDY
ncbi:hypothetical protein GCK72_021836 [Caenorhabditis remanei]|uniref:Uncharacterized protein n=1 Tax=Caenorhabditis remanei TaxID=31234 RepID=A0A6A5GJ50_CAERE|nr:hypothetical protein GCK72_021836 [Caenorhabditis remanei]KAF1755267.1 hypothetical protein GCK72_021836 [Caenorhabditis remanei]